MRDDNVWATAFLGDDIPLRVEIGRTDDGPFQVIHLGSLAIHCNGTDRPALWRHLGAACEHAAEFAETPAKPDR